MDLSRFSDYVHLAAIEPHGLYAVEMHPNFWTYAGSVPAKLMVKINDKEDCRAFHSKQEAIDHFNQIFPDGKIQAGELYEVEVVGLDWQGEKDIEI